MVDGDKMSMAGDNVYFSESLTFVWYVKIFMTCKNTLRLNFCRVQLAAVFCLNTSVFVLFTLKT